MRHTTHFTRTLRSAMAGLAFAAAVLLAASFAAAQRSDSSPADWGQWRGPKRDNLSAETGLLKQWPDKGPPLAWKAKGVGAGYSTVSVAGGRIYTTGDKGGASYVHALDTSDGKSLWSAKAGRPGGDYPGTRSTPTVDGDRVYALGQF